MHREAASIISELMTAIPRELGARFVGLYLYGSAATGDFLSGVSDVDLLAATNGDLDANDLERLAVMHADLARRQPQWADRIEVAYVSTDALAHFKEGRGQIVRISPGEPLHVRPDGMGSDWLMDWHLIRNGGRVLLGPTPDFIAPTTHEEFVESLREHVRTADDWLNSVKHRGGMAYVTLTLCRTLVAVETGRHSSKRDAATWVGERFPQWRELIADALSARSDAVVSASPANEDELAELRAFFGFTRARV